MFPCDQLSAKRRVTVEEFKGNLLVSIREFYEDRNDGIMKPGKKGEGSDSSSTLDDRPKAFPHAPR